MPSRKSRSKKVSKSKKSRKVKMSGGGEPISDKVVDDLTDLEKNYIAFLSTNLNKTLTHEQVLEKIVPFKSRNNIQRDDAYGYKISNVNGLNTITRLQNK